MADVDVASLGLSVNTAQVSAATAQLNQFTQAGHAASAAASAFNAQGQFNAQTVQQNFRQWNAFTQAVGAWTPVAGQATQASNTMATAHQNLGRSANLTAQQIQFLGFQVNDVFTSLASGMSLTTVLAQQGGQFFQIFQSHPQGVVAGLRSAISWFGQLFTVSRLTMGGIIGLVIEGATAWGRFNSLQQEVNITMTSTGRIVGQTASQFMEMTGNAAAQFGLSRRSAIELGTALASTGKLGADNINRIIGLSKDFGTTFGLSAGKAQEALVKTFTDPQRGIAELNNQLNFLDAGTVRTVNNLVAQGRQQEAIRIAVDRMPSALAKYEENTGAVAKAWDLVRRTASDADLAVGQFLNHLSNPTGVTQQLALIEQRIQQLKNEANENLVPPGGRVVDVPAGTVASTRPPPPRAAPSGLGTQLAERARLEEQQEQFAESARRQAVVLELRNMSRELDAMIPGLARGSREFQQATNSSALFQKALEPGNERLREMILGLRGLTVGTEEYDRRLADLNEASEVNRHVVESQLTQGQQRITQAQNEAQVLALQRQLEGETNNERRIAIQQEITRVRARGDSITQTNEENRVTEVALSMRKQMAVAIREDIYTLDRQAQLYGTVGQQREIATNLLSRELQYRRAGMELGPAELALFRQRLTTDSDRARVQQQLDSIYSASIKPAEDYNNTVRAATILYQQGRINVIQYGNAIDDARIKMLQADQTASSGMQAGALRVARDFGDTSKQLEGFTTSSFNTISTSLTDMALRSKSVRDGFKDMGAAVGRALTEMLIRMLLLAPVARSLQSLLSGIPGFGAGGTPGVVPNLYPSPIGPGMPGMQSGGSLGYGRFAIVGERGRPEIVEGPATVSPHVPAANQNFQLVINEAPGGDKASVREERTSGGMSVIVDMVSNAQARQIARGQGPLARAQPVLRG